MKIYRELRNTLEYAVEEAEVKGLKKGKAEEQRQIVANLKKQGVDIKVIAKCTGLSDEEIEQL